MNIYIAAPLFSPNERAFNELLASALASVGVVYLPQRDGTLIEEHAKVKEGHMEDVCRAVFQEDLHAIRRSEVIVAVLDGRAIDEGVCIEIGFAKALGKRIVGFKSDVRVALPWGQNPVLAGCIDAWATSIGGVVGVLAES